MNMFLSLDKQPTTTFTETPQDLPPVLGGGPKGPGEVPLPPKE